MSTFIYLLFTLKIKWQQYFNDVTYMYRFGPDNKVPKTRQRHDNVFATVWKCFYYIYRNEKNLTFDALSRLRRIETHFNVVLTGMTQ